MRRIGLILSAAVLGLLLTAGPALGCGGLIGPNGAVNLLRTTTFAGYHDGEEHYVTSFEFAGGGEKFGLSGIGANVAQGLRRFQTETTSNKGRHWHFSAMNLCNQLSPSRGERDFVKKFTNSLALASDAPLVSKCGRFPQLLCSRKRNWATIRRSRGM